METGVTADIRYYIHITLCVGPVDFAMETDVTAYIR